MARRPKSQSRRMGDSWADQEEALFGFATSRPDEGPTPSSSSRGNVATAVTTNNINSGSRGSNGRRGAGHSTSTSDSGGGGVPSGTGTGTGAWRDSARSAGRTMRRRIEDVWTRMEAYPGTIATVPPSASNDGSLWPWEEGRAGGRGDTHHRNQSSRPVGDGGGGIDGRPAPTSTSSQGATPGSSSFLPELSLSSLSRRVTSALVNHARVPQCVVCGTLAPSRYQYHPFFPEEIACSTHSNVGRCSGCNRFEPSPGSTFGGNQFADLGDRGRKLCPSCLRTVVTDSDEGRQLWFNVLRFLDSDHGLFAGDGGGGLRASMEGIPVLVVEHDALNDPGVRGSGHHDHGRGRGGGEGNGGGGGSHTRGLCVYEYTAHPLGGQLRTFLRSAGVSDVRGIIGDVLGTTKATRVTAVLCLRGLPRDLAASVLAHEATHAWFKLHGSYDPHGGMLPLVVEEGCCQLVAYLYLRHLEEGDDDDDRGSRDGDDELRHEHGPSDGRLRQYFRYSIETMTDEVYGEGFRLAAAAYAACGASSPGGSSLRVLLDYVAENGSFPPPPA